MAAESMLDPMEQAGITATRLRGWDEIARVITTSQVNFLNTGTQLTNNAVRFLNGTPDIIRDPGSAAKPGA